MFSKAKAGDKVWHNLLGWGIIQLIDDDDFIKVQFGKALNLKDTLSCHSYHLSGKFSANDTFPSIFWDIPTITYPKKPKSIVKKEVKRYMNIYGDEDFANYAYPSLEIALCKRASTCISTVELTGSYETEED